MKKRMNTKKLVYIGLLALALMGFKSDFHLI